MDHRQLVESLQLLELAQVSVSATVDPSGRLGPVGGLWPKLLAAATEAATVGLLRAVVVAQDQPDIPKELEHEGASPLRVLRATTIQEVVRKLYEEHGPREALRRHEREQGASLDILGKSVPLVSHYQVLPLLQEVRRERLPRAGQKRNREKEQGAEDSGIGGADILRWEEELREERITYERLPLAQVFSDFQSVAKRAKTPVPRFVVLGPPGSGKTTLVQYLAWQAANRVLCLSGRLLLPVRLRLREWELWALGEGALERSLPQYLTERYKDLSPAPHLAQWQGWLQRGEVLLLLDGLDEIEGKPGFLTAVKTALLACKDCPVLLTCRTVSFDQHRALCPDLPIFTLAELDPDRRNACIRTFPAEHGDYDSELLINQLSRSPHLLPLAANPLLLHIICYTADTARGVLLPTTRGAFYRRALEKLLTYRARRVEVRYPGEEPSLDEKLMILQRAAFNLFTQSERRLVFSGEELGQALKQALGEEGYGQTPALWANALRADLLHNSGILRGNTEQGFFFLHLTLHEFLVAAAIVRRVNENGWHAPLEIAGKTVSVCQLIDRRAWDPRWQEIVTFLAGQLIDPLPLLALLADTKKDDVFSHRLALAALCLPEVQLGFDKKRSAIADRITAAVVSRWLRHERQGTIAAVPHLTRALAGLAHVNRRVENTPLLQWLCLRLRDVNPEVRSGIIEACGHIGESLAQHPEVLSALVVALHDKDVLVRVKAVETLRRVGGSATQHLDVLPTLVQTALQDEDWFVRFGATRALEHMGETTTQHPEVHSLLLKMRQTQSPRQPVFDVQEIDQQGTITPRLETIPALVTALRDPDESARTKAAAALTQLGKSGLQHPQVLPTLIEVALHDTDGGVRAQAVDALGRMDTRNSQQAEALLVLVAALHDTDGGVRAQAAKALGQSEQAATYGLEVLSALLDALRDTDSDVRFEAAEALGRLMARGLRVFQRWWGKTVSKTVEELAM